MENGFRLLCIFLIGSLTLVSCNQEGNLRDRAAVRHVENHFNNSHYDGYLELQDVEVTDEIVDQDRTFDMEVHELTLIANVDIKESYVVSKFHFGNFLEIDESWSKERQRRLDEAESEDQIHEIKETYLRHAFEKGEQSIEVKLSLTFNETEDRWMVLNMTMQVLT